MAGVSPIAIQGLVRDANFIPEVWSVKGKVRVANKIA
jgi:hypothetical protein